MRMGLPSPQKLKTSKKERKKKGKNETLSFIATRIELEAMLLSEISFAEEDEHLCFVHSAEATITVKLTL